MKRSIHIAFAAIIFLAASCSDNPEYEPGPVSYSLYSFKVDEKNATVEETTERILIIERINHTGMPISFKEEKRETQYTNTLVVEFEGDYDHIVPHIEEKLYASLETTGMRFPLDYDNKWQFTPGKHENNYLYQELGSFEISVWVTYRLYHEVVTRTVEGGFEIEVLSRGEMSTIKGKYTATYNYVILSHGEINIPD